MFNGEPGPASAGASRNVVRSSSISGEICGSQQAGGGAGTTTAKKRRSSLGAKMVAIVGLTQWSKSTLQLPQPGEGCGHKEMVGGVGVGGECAVVESPETEKRCTSVGAVWAGVCDMLWFSVAGSNSPERKSQVLQPARAGGGVRPRAPVVLPVSCTLRAAASMHRRGHV